MNEIKHVVLCAGHTSTERGAVNRELKLSEWVCAQVLTRTLYFTAPLSFTIDTITDDNFIEKVKRINTKMCDLCVDVHFNSSTRSDARGTEVLYCEASDRGERLAELVLGTSLFDKRRIVPVSKCDKGCYFLWKTYPIAIIWEVCFISDTYEILSCLSQVQDVALEFWRAVKEYNHRYASNVYNDDTE